VPLTHFVILTARNTYPEQQPQVNGTFFLPLFTNVVGQEFSEVGRDLNLITKPGSSSPGLRPLPMVGTPVNGSLGLF
jgi:hypothetical protein